MQTNPLKLFVRDNKSYYSLAKSRASLKRYKSTAKSKNKKLEITIYK